MYTVHGQLTHMHAVGSSFHSKASAWKTISCYIYALDMYQQNITWEMLSGVLLFDAIIFLLLPKPLLFCFDDNVASTTALTINGRPRL